MLRPVIFVAGLALALTVGVKHCEARVKQPLPAPKAATAPAASPSDVVPVANPPSVMQGKPVVTVSAVELIPADTIVIDPCAPACPQSCCPDQCITYRERGHRRCCDSCQPDLPSVLLVKNPQTCCLTAVPVCLPVCVCGEPCVDSRCGLLHRGIVDHKYQNGFRITVVFDKRGDVLVTYHYV